MGRRLLLLAGATMATGLVAAASLRGQQQPPSSASGQEPPTFRSGVNAVRVDAVVTDKNGAQVFDMTADDFEITEGGKKQQIETFKLVSVDGRLPVDIDPTPVGISSAIVEEQEASRDEVRVFAIYLDDYNVSPPMRQVVRGEVARFVERELAPADMVGVMHPLSALTDVRFTRNHTSVIHEIQQFGAAADALGKVNGRGITYGQAFDNFSPGTGGTMRLDVTFSAIKALITRLGAMKEGRKSLILVTEGYRGDWSSMRQQLGDLTELANKNNTALYPVNPRLLPPETASTLLDESFRLLANGSGGRAIFDRAKSISDLRESRRLLVPRSNMAEAMKQIVADSSGYYLLGYRSTLTVPDGKYHKIDLKVKRRGVEVRYRKGYWARTAAELERVTVAPTPRDTVSYAVEAAMAAVTIPRVLPVRTWVGMERGGNGQTRMIFSWERTPVAPGDTMRDADRPAKVTLEAKRPGGATYFSGEVPSSISFEAPPGPVQLRVVVESRGLEVIDRETRNVTAIDFGTGAVMIGTPQLFRARNAAEFQRLQATHDAAPTATRDFSRGERLLIRVPAYALGDEVPVVTAALMSRAGEVMTALPVASDDSRFAFIDLTLSNLAPGVYAIRMTATSGTEHAEETVAFRVTN